MESAHIELIARRQHLTKLAARRVFYGLIAHGAVPARYPRSARTLAALCLARYQVAIEHHPARVARARLQAREALRRLGLVGETDISRILADGRDSELAPFLEREPIR